MKSSITLIRNATILIKLGGNTILVDPMLGKKDSMEPVPMAANEIRIPMVELPFTDAELADLLATVDLVLVTHTHPDHWDEAAQNLLPKQVPVLCQPADLELIQGQGFAQTQAISDKIKWNNLLISRTSGQHGTGDIGKMMGSVSGFVLDDGKQKIYVAGDTIWCPEVAAALETHQPDVVVVNAGAGQFVHGDAITMTAKDVHNTVNFAPAAQVVAVHLDTVNHCYLTRSHLRRYLAQHNLNQVLIPADGESLTF